MIERPEAPPNVRVKEGPWGYFPVKPKGTPWYLRKEVCVYAPVLATALLEYANVGQLWRMWTERTAAGQSVTSWFAVFLALACYNQFYRVCVPDQKWAYRMNVLGMVMNLSVCLTVIYFRYFA